MILARLRWVNHGDHEQVTKVHAVTQLIVKQTTGWSVLSADPLALLFVDGLDTCLIMSVINCFVSARLLLIKQRAHFLCCGSSRE